jgi:hypothetical protein
VEKLDKVIAGLECCGEANEIVNVCLEVCPYYGERDGDKVCMDLLMKDALELLRGVRLLEAERDFAANLALAYGEFVEATLEQEAKK